MTNKFSKLAKIALLSAALGTAALGNANAQSNPIQKPVNVFTIEYNGEKIT